MTRRIIVSAPPLKPILSPSTAETITPSSEPDNSDISTLLTKTIEILRREVTHLLVDSARGKLEKSSSTDLVNYIKLLTELHASEKDLLDDLSDEELLVIVEERNVKSKSKGSREGIEEEG